MALIQHTEELRAELGACIDRRERMQIAAELRAAEARKTMLDREASAAS